MQAYFIEILDFYWGKCPFCTPLWWINIHESRISRPAERRRRCHHLRWRPPGRLPSLLRKPRTAPEDQGHRSQRWRISQLVIGSYSSLYQHTLCKTIKFPSVSTVTTTQEKMLSSSIWPTSLLALRILTTQREYPWLVWEQIGSTIIIYSSILVAYYGRHPHAAATHDVNVRNERRPRCGNYKATARTDEELCKFIEFASARYTK